MSEQAPHGFQIESGDLNGDYWCAIANTENGTIPGKSSNGKCWYPYGGLEVESTDFKIVDGPVIFTDDPNEVKPLGKQTDGAGILYCAVVETEWGKIPGKAKRGTAWYSYGGEERSTSDTSKIKYVGPSIATLAGTEQVLSPLSCSFLIHIFRTLITVVTRCYRHKLYTTRRKTSKGLPLTTMLRLAQSIRKLRKRDSLQPYTSLGIMLIMVAADTQEMMRTRLRR